MLNYYYQVGQEQALDELRKEAGVAVGIGGAIDPILAALLGDSGKKLKSAGGSFLGQAAGSLAGGGAGAAGGGAIGSLAGLLGDHAAEMGLTGAAVGGIGGSIAGSLVGGYKGARAMHGDYKNGLKNILKGELSNSEKARLALRG